MNTTFGARLRSHREQRQIPLAAIAEQTKIKASLLEALERDDLSKWPGGIFRRAYVKTYAQAIGLEPDAVVKEFLELYPEPVEEDVSASLAAARGLSSRPPARLRLMLGSAIGALPSRRQAAQKEVLGIDGAGTAATPPPPRQPQVGAHHEDETASPTVQAPPVPTPPEAAEAGREHEPLPAPLAASAHEDVGLSEIAQVCTRLACAGDEREVRCALAEATRALDAVGLILWVWDPRVGALGAALAHGYPDDVLGQLPRVRPEADNAIAAAFRSLEPRVVESGSQTTGAVVVPLGTAFGCAGVLALEIRAGAEARPALLAMARILAAQVSTLFAEMTAVHAATA